MKRRSGSERLAGPLHGVAVYNPDLLAKHELLRLFVARRPLLERIVRDLRDETEGVPQHHLLVGRRGMGKTTLLRRLRHAIEDDNELDARWVALTFPEEQYNVAALSDFWLNCVDALADALEARGRRENLAEIDEQVAEIAGLSHEGDRRARALSLLLRLADGVARRLVLLVDNLDLVFSRVDQDDWAIREVLSREPRLLLIGATSHALESSFRYDKAFYDFFRIHQLDGLDEAQTFQVMRHLAEVTGQPRVLDVIDREPGRIQTLRLLAGGNPRTLVLLFNLLAQGTEGDARSDLERLLDQVTPLYKHRFEQLPAQAQRVVDALALGWDPMTARALADRLRLEVNLVSAQLNRLVKQGIIEKTRLPGNAKVGFQIAERFFNIWYLMRASRRMRRRLMFLVKFLELFFPQESLRAQATRRLRAGGDSEDADYGFALALATRDGGLRHALETHSLRVVLADPREELRAILDLDGDDQPLAMRAERIQALMEAERAVLAKRDWPEGLDGPQFWQLFGGSLILSAAEKRDISGRLDQLTDAQLVRMREIFEEEYGYLSGGSAAVVLLRAAVQDGYVDSELATDDIESVGALTGSGSVSAYLYFRSAVNLKSNSGRFEEAEAAYRRAIEHDPEYAYPWNGLGALLQYRLGRFDEAEAAYRRAIELDPKQGAPWHNLGNLLQYRLGRFDEAGAAFERACALEPNDPTILNGRAWWLYTSKRELETAEQLAQKAVDVEPGDPYRTHTLACIQAARGKWPAEPARHFCADEEFRNTRWDHILQFFQEAVRHGHVSDARSLLQSLEEADAWAPLIAALDVIEHDDRERLLNLSPEMRSAAKLALARIAPDR